MYDKAIIMPPISSTSVDTCLLDDCYSRSLDLLRRNSSADGILAASATAEAGRRGYASIFGRDASICALGMAASGESDLIDCARAGLQTLAGHQAGNGQIPKFVRPRNDEADFWYTGCIDATLWWLIAIRVCDRITGTSLLSDRLSVHIERALGWLACQEHQTLRLLQQNEASDWADIMPRSGFVLYSNALWYWVKQLYDIHDAPETRKNARLIFSPFSNSTSDNRRLRILMHYVRNKARRTPYYLSFVNLSVWGEEIDIFGNILACLTRLTDTSQSTKMIHAMSALGAAAPFPVRVVGIPISSESRLWRTYMQRHRQNLPWQYHNGGIWPFAGGFWTILLHGLRLHDHAWRHLESLASANRINGWEFNEWLHGRTAEPLGMPGQSWNAALYVLAHHSVCHNLSFFR